MHERITIRCSDHKMRLKVMMEWNTFLYSLDKEKTINLWEIDGTKLALIREDSKHGLGSGCKSVKHYKVCFHRFFRLCILHFSWWNCPSALQGWRGHLSHGDLLPAFRWTEKSQRAFVAHCFSNDFNSKLSV